MICHKLKKFTTFYGYRTEMDECLIKDKICTRELAGQYSGRNVKIKVLKFKLIKNVREKFLEILK